MNISETNLSRQDEFDIFKHPESHQNKNKIAFEFYDCFLMKLVVKNDSRTDRFDKNKIVSSIWRAQNSGGEGDRNQAEILAAKVITLLEAACEENSHPHVRQIRTITKQLLDEEGYPEAGAAYAADQGQSDDSSDTWRALARLLAAADSDEEDHELTALNFEQTLADAAFCPGRELRRNFALEKKVSLSSIALNLSQEKNLWLELEKLAQVKNRQGRAGIRVTDFHQGDLLDLMAFIAAGLKFCSEQNRLQVAIAINHPQILSIIGAQELVPEFKQWGLALELPADFFQAVENNSNLELRFTAQQRLKSVPARVMLEMIGETVVRRKNISLLFRANTPPYQALDYKGVPLADYGSSTDGSLFLDKLIRTVDGCFNADKMAAIINQGSHLLFNALLVNEYCCPAIAVASKKNPHVHLRLKNLENLFTNLNITADSQAAEDICRTIDKTIRDHQITSPFKIGSLTLQNSSINNHNLRLAALCAGGLPVIVAGSLPPDHNAQNCANDIILAQKSGIAALRFR